ncbi:DNA polymerase IV [Rhodovulum sulfidophilum]|uniref:DNA polymerase IV n=1 Tax=Rhodovulum sulfidophilum TaxID=35806 RepID=UPI0013895B1B|nr:DNA polymerase IV [Rhodovulum sulfidophilum]NDK33546.1 DNA polymerase IV [Rhodovulum sulfidophilum]
MCGDESRENAAGPGRGPADARSDPPRRIIHVDMDAFFASVEQRDRPELRDRPVAVGHGRARGVVAAASYEAREFGVRSAMPSVTALRKCPELIFVPPRFEVYRGVSADIHVIFAEYTDLVEPLSLDEAYLDVSQACADGRPASEIAEEIRARIRAATGLTASAGVSYNKFLAKLASDQNKPDGLTVIPPHRAAAFVAGLPVGRFHGVGPVTEAKMLRLGIRSGADLRAKSLAFLQAHFGSSAAHYHAISRGIDPRPVRPDRPRKSIGAETTLSEDLSAFEAATEVLARLAAKLSRPCAEKGLAGRTVTVKVRFTDFEQVTRRRTLSRPLTETAEMLEVARQLLAGLHPFPRPVRLLGITLSGLEPRAEAAAEKQLDLFDEGSRNSG